MKLQVNGSEIEVAATNVAALLDELAYRGARVATALNGNLVRKHERNVTTLSAGDSIEIIAPMQGG